MSTTDDRFNWSSDPTIVVRSQPAVAVYTNAGGTIVIRQEAGWGESEDTFVLITPNAVRDFVQALVQEAGIPELDEQRPQAGICSSTGAARSRTYRERQKVKLLTHHATVTKRDAQSVTDRDARDVTLDQWANDQERGP